MIARQLLPNVGPYVAINFLLTVTGAIYAEIGLFLLGVAPVSGTNRGIMIQLAMGNGALYTSKSMLYLFSPMAAIGSASRPRFLRPCPRPAVQSPAADSVMTSNSTVSASGDGRPR